MGKARLSVFIGKLMQGARVKLKQRPQERLESRKIKQDIGAEGQKGGIRITHLRLAMCINYLV